MLDISTSDGLVKKKQTNKILAGKRIILIFFSGKKVRQMKQNMYMQYVSHPETESVFHLIFRDCLLLFFFFFLFPCHLPCTAAILGCNNETSVEGE